MNWIAAGVVMMGAVAGCVDSVPTLAANKTDPRFVWPKNSQFTCRGFLTQEQGVYGLTPDPGMLAWCDADIGHKDKRRVSDACKLGDHCEIKGTIKGHGSFGWAEITSVKAVAGTASALELSEAQARNKAAVILQGDPYGPTVNVAASRIQKAQLLTAGTTDCGGGAVTRPVWQFHITVPANVVSYGNEPINGYLVLDARSGKMLCASLPFLD